MVITLYTDRRSHEVTDVASRLAAAFVALMGSDQVLLVTPRSGGGDEPGDGGYHQAPLVDAAAPEAIGSRLATFAGRYATVVAALSGAPNEQVLATLDASDRVLLLSDSSVASVRGTQRTLKLCASLGYDPAKVGVVLYDFADDAPLAPADAAVALKREILCIVPAPGAHASEQEASYTRLARLLIGRG